MKPPAPSSHSMLDLRDFTPARVGLGRAGASMPTKALLEFTLDHARARDAVHAAFDVPAMISRPDLGRTLDPGSAQRLASRSGSPCQLAIVLGDGLSPTAVHAHAIELVRSLIGRLAVERIEIGHAVVASGARVALGDEIGAILAARMIVMLIGERPGLSAPDSLGAYLSFAPRIGLTDAERNCVSNIHGSGLGYDEAAVKIAWLIREGLARQVTGVALKDESGGRTSQRVMIHSSRHDKSET